MRIPLPYKVQTLLLLLTISAPTVTTAQDNSAEATLLFDLSLSELMDVEITTAGKTKERIKDIPASVIVVTRKDIERYGYTTLTDILENIPSMYNVYNYEGAPGNFGMRGFLNPRSQNSNVAILVNNVRQYQDDTRSHPMSKITVPVEAIDRVEIIRGPMGVMYGSGASFGVINIITNDISDKNDVSLVSAGYGSRNTSKTSVRVSEIMDEFKFVINASHYETDGLDNKFSDMISLANQTILPFVGVTDPNYSTKDLLEHSNQYFGFSGSYRKLYFDFSYNRTNVDAFALYPSLVDGIENDVKSTNLMLGYADDVNRWLALDGQIVLSKHNESDNVDFLDPTQPGQVMTNYDTWEVELKSTIKPNKQWQVIAGFNQRTMKNLKLLFNVPAAGVNNRLIQHSNRTVRSIFSQVTYTPDSRWTLVAGLRQEDNLDYDNSTLEASAMPPFESNNVPKNSNTLPRVAAIYHLNDYHTYKLLYGEASKLANDITNNPESTKTLEFIHSYSKQRVSVLTSIFRNELEDLFVEQILPTGPVGSLEVVPFRAGKLSTNGLEITITNRITNKLHSELSTTYQKTDDDFLTDDAAYSPTLLVHAKITYGYKTNTYSLLGRYIGSMETSMGSIIPPFGDPSIRAGEKIDGYYVFDANWRQEKIFGDAYLNFKITNLFDEEIRYPNNTELSSLLDKGTLGPERSIFGTLGWKF